MKNSKLNTILLIVLIIILGVNIWLMNKKAPVDISVPVTAGTPSVVSTLYASYKNGVISQCVYNGAVVYSAGMNAYDGGSVVVDAEGNTIDTVLGMTGRSEHGIAENLTNCTRVYVVNPNIWGFPPVNTFNLQ
jgi:hypothetical protein